MKVWTCTGFQGRWPVPTAAVVVADTAAQAAQLLNEELVLRSLPGDVTEEQMTRLPTNKPAVLVLSDGNY